jgi:hypothetical protein
MRSEERVGRSRRPVGYIILMRGLLHPSFPSDIESTRLNHEVYVVGRDVVLPLRVRYGIAGWAEVEGEISLF